MYGMRYRYWNRARCVNGVGFVDDNRNRLRHWDGDGTFHINGYRMRHWNGDLTSDRNGLRYGNWNWNHMIHDVSNVLYRSVSPNDVEIWCIYSVTI